MDFLGALEWDLRAMDLPAVQRAYAADASCCILRHSSSDTAGMYATFVDDLCLGGGDFGRSPDPRFSEPSFPHARALFVASESTALGRTDALTQTHRPFLHSRCRRAQLLSDSNGYTSVREMTEC